MTAQKARKKVKNSKNFKGGHNKYPCTNLYPRGLISIGPYDRPKSPQKREELQKISRGGGKNISGYRNINIPAPTLIQGG